ncbi:MAG: efflux RND transporter periplasmic adaptor subunit [Alphaproteobacteria bacterium]|nr:efflux RND transporter periplasmic adaptor subunit [Alphaproteobacteria bacterium]
MSQDNKSALLDSLRIERKAPLAPSRAPWMIAAVVLLAALAGGGWYFWPDSRVTVHAVTAQAQDAGSVSGLDASGYVVARRKATLSAKILGKVTEVNFEEGDQVKAGDIVARLDDSNQRAALMEAEAKARQAKATLDNTAPIYARYQKLKSEGAISTDAVETQRLAYENARTAHQVAQAGVATAASFLKDTLVRAPFSGIVTVKVAQVGEVVAPSAAGGGDTRTGIVTIVDMDSLEVQVDVSENYIDRVKVGGAAIIHLDAYPEWDIPGQVIAIIPTADQSKGTVEVRVSIKAKDGRILPQMAARVAFMDMPGKGAVAAISRVTVPAQAVQAHGRTGDIYVIKEDDTLEKRSVALGPVSQQTAVILSGVMAGEKLAAGDLSNLRDGEQVKIAE